MSFDNKVDANNGSDDDTLTKVDDREWGKVWKEFALEYNIDSFRTAAQLKQYLYRVHVRLTDKTCSTLMAMCSTNQKGYLHLTPLKDKVREAISKNAGLPIDQAIGGSILEWNASTAGRRHRHNQSLQSMDALVAASSKSIAHYTLNQLNQNKQSIIDDYEKKQRKAKEKYKRQLKREKMLAKKEGRVWVDPRIKKATPKQKLTLKLKPQPNIIKPIQPPLKLNNPSPKPNNNNNNHPSPNKYNNHPSPKKYNITDEKYFAPTPRDDDDDDDDDDDSDGSMIINDDVADDINTPVIKTPVVVSDNNEYRIIRKQSQNQSQNPNQNQMQNNDDIDSDNDSNLLNEMIAVNGGQDLIEMISSQSNMLYRIGTRIASLDNRMNGQHDIKNIFRTHDLSVRINECLAELAYLKTSSIALLNNELSSFKIDLFNEFESISISSAYDVSNNIRSDLHLMNNNIDRTVRLWNNNWNINKTIQANQNKLDRVLYRAEKILLRYNEFQSNIKTITLSVNNTMELSMPRFIREMDKIHGSLSSIDNYLSTFVFDRLSRCENALIRIFTATNNNNNKAITLKNDNNNDIKDHKDDDNDDNDNDKTKKFSVDELMNQLDSQRLNHEAELKKKSNKITKLQNELNKQNKLMQKEKKTLKIREENNQNLFGKFQTELAKNKELEFELLQLKSQLKRVSINKTFNNINHIDNNNSAIHPDINEDPDPNVSRLVNSDLKFPQYYSNSLSTLIGDFIKKCKTEHKYRANKHYANRFSRDINRGHLTFALDELPKFLSSTKNRDAQQQDLEEKLGFGYDELYYLYRENTEINIRNTKLENENEHLKERLRERIEPIIIIQNIQTASKYLEKGINYLGKQLTREQSKLKSVQSRLELSEKQINYIDKYRLEMLFDTKKIENELKAKMNFTKFQFQRQRKKMNALMKSEKDGVLKERKIMKQEREEIKKLSELWEKKLKQLENKEKKFNEKVHLAKSNMNEVVFQTGLADYLRDHSDELKEELRDVVDKEMIAEQTESIRNRFEASMAKQKAYYNKRYILITKKLDESFKNIDNLKLQIQTYQKKVAKLEDNDVFVNNSYYELEARYDVLLDEFKKFKVKYKELELKKNIKPIVQQQQLTSYQKQHKKGRSGPLAYLDIDDDDDDVTKLEKKSIKEWLMQRHGVNDLSPKHNQHWLHLPSDVIAGLKQDIVELKSTNFTLRQQLDEKNILIGQQQNKLTKLSSSSSSLTAKEDNKLLDRVGKSQNDIIGKFEEYLPRMKKNLAEWEEGIATVTRAEDRWREKHTDLVTKEKQIAKEREELLYDQRQWYAHKNHILRQFYYFTKQIWWERFVQHEFHASRAQLEIAYEVNMKRVHRQKQLEKKQKDNPDAPIDDPPPIKPLHHMDCQIWNQYYKMILESWFEAGVFQHALTRYFCQYTTPNAEKAQFYYSSNDHNPEELYIFRDDIIKSINPHLNDVIERYYKQKWKKRYYKFGRCWVTSEKPYTCTPLFKNQRSIVKEILTSLYYTEPGFNKCDIHRVINRIDKAMLIRCSSFKRVHWDAVKMVDGVGVLTNKETAKAKHELWNNNNNNKRSSGSYDKSKKKKSIRFAPQAIKTQVPTQTQTPNKSTTSTTDVTKDDEKNVSQKSLDEELAARQQNQDRNTLKTPKAQQDRVKTWSHAMDNFKSGGKKRKKKLTPEQKEKLRKKKAEKQKQNNQNKNNNDKKRSSGKYSASNSGIIKTIKPQNDQTNPPNI